MEGRYSNAIGLAGWWFNSVILRRKQVPSGQAVMFNRIVPMIKWFESRVRLPFGQSVVGVARKPVSAAWPSDLNSERRIAA